MAWNQNAKIDGLAVEGLLGVSDSLGYKVHEIEKHHHSRARWLGIHGTPTATNWADDALTPFSAISGANAYGADADDEAEVLGTDDTPAITGMVKFDLHQLLITAVSVSTPYKLRVVYGTGTMANAITAGQYSECMIQFDSSNPQLSAGIPVDINMPRLTAGVDKIWIQAWCATDNATIGFLVGIHEYVG